MNLHNGFVTFLEYLNPESAVAPAGPYSHLSVTTQDARIATFAGQIGVDADGQIPRIATEQARLVFASIATLLASQGAAPADLIRMMTLIVGRDTLQEFNAVRREVYAEWFPNGNYPPNTVALVAGLASESILVEIEGCFVCP